MTDDVLTRNARHDEKVRKEMANCFMYMKSEDPSIPPDSSHTNIVTSENVPTFYSAFMMA
jgi:hypothetical protein